MADTEQYTVVNRLNRVFIATYDGRHYELDPHEEKVYPSGIAFQFKQYNPQMGSLDPRTGKITFLVGIKELNDPCDPIEEILIDPRTGRPHIEVWDRSKLTGARPSEIVPGDNGLYSENVWKSSQSTDLNFSGR